jgi:hypothetical protein
MGTANTGCTDWRWEYDDGDGGSHIQNAHVDLSSPDSWLDTNICWRALLYNSGDKNEEDGYRLEYSIDAGSNWDPVTTSSSYVRSASSGNFTDGDSTSQELGAGTFDEGYWDDNGSIASYTLAQTKESEHEFCFQFRSADCGGQTVLIRIAFDDGSDLDSYTYSNPSCTFAGGAIYQKNFRVRYDLDALNSEGSGWIANLNTNCEVDSDTRFRIRYELEEATGSSKSIGALKLQYNKNSGGWVDITAQTWQAETANPTCMITTTDNYADGDATTNLLSGSSESFTAGTGEENAAIAGVDLASEHTEIEVCLVIRKFYDGPSHNADGDTFDFRLVESDGTALDGYTNTPTITLNHASGHIGGTFVESPGRIGPFCDTNNNLYTIIEPAETDNDMLMVKSTDGGASWAEVDGSNRPTTTDLEAVDVQQVTDTLWILHQGVSDNVKLHKFRMSDHSTNPDTWELTDEAVRTVSNSPTDQSVAIAVLSDNRVRGFWAENDGTYDRLYYDTRNTGGSWNGSPLLVDNTASTDFAHVMVTVGASDKVHIFYKDETNDTIYHKSLSSGGVPGSRHTVESDAIAGGISYNAMTEAVYWDNAGTEELMIVVHDSDEYLYSVVISDDGTPDSRKAASDNTCARDCGGSRQTNATLAIDAATDTAWLLYVQGSGQAGTNILRDSAENDGGWGTDATELSASNTDWVRAQVYTRSGTKYLGYIYDAGSAGGTGFIEHAEYEIPTGEAAVAIMTPSRGVWYPVGG